MKAEIKYIYSPDIDNLEHYSAQGAFALLVQIIMSPKGEEGEESFNVTVCSPAYLEKTLGEDIINCRHYVIMKEFNYRNSNYHKNCEHKRLTSQGKNASKLAGRYRAFA